jgi:hypothetical protein
MPFECFAQKTLGSGEGSSLHQKLTVSPLLSVVQ